ncbi:MAG TPA: TIR domain-containing protein [Pengzhenrongella sp.]
MADVMLSYAHEDFGDAMALRTALSAQGWSVWLDESGEDPDDPGSVGVPVGTRHWDVIADEIAAATVVVALATGRWHSKPYCQRERAYAQSLGKWVAEIDRSGDVQRLDAQLREREPYAAAHARMLNRGERPGRRWWADLFVLPDAEDAAAVLGGDAESMGITVTPELVARCRADLDRRRVARRRQGRMTVAFAAVWSLLAVVALAGWRIAAVQRDAAQASARQATALELVAQSRAEANTVVATRDAAEAVALSPSDSARAQLASARRADARLRSIPIASATFSSATWSAGSDALVAVSGSRVYRADVVNGTVDGPFDLGGPLDGVGSVVLSSDGETVYYVRDRSLVEQRLKDGFRKELVGGGYVGALASGDGAILWWGDGTRLVRQVAVEVGSADPGTSLELSDAVVALTTLDDDSAVALTTDGMLHHVVVDDDVLVEESSVVATDPFTTGRWTALEHCGQQVHGSTGRSAGETSISVVDFAWSPGERDVQPGHYAFGERMLCGWGDQALVAGPFRSLYATGAAAPTLAAWSWGVVGVMDPTGQRVAVIDDSGVLSIFSQESSATEERVDDAASFLALDDDTWVVRDDGHVVSYDDPTLDLGAVDGEPVPVGVLSAGPWGLIVTTQSTFLVRDRELVHLDAIRGRVADVRIATDGQSAIILTSEELVVLDDQGQVLATRDARAADQEYISVDIRVGAAAVVGVTAEGRVEVVAEDDLSTVLAAATVDLRGSNGWIAALADGRTLVLGSDGTVHVLDGSLRAGEDVATGLSAVFTVRATSEAVLVTTGDWSTVVLDTATLQSVDRLDRIFASGAPVLRNGRPVYIGASLGTERYPTSQALRSIPALT